MNIEVKFDIQHTSKNKLNLISSSGPLRINDINSAFRQNYNVFTEFIAQVSAIYDNTYNNYIKLRTFYNVESDEYEPALDKLKDDINELTDLLKKNDIIKPEDITKALEEAEARTEQDIKETEENADKTAQKVWDTNKGYETSSDIQDKGKAAAEEYAKNSALAHEAALAQEAANKAEETAKNAKSEAAKAQEAFNSAKDKQSKAEADLNAAEKEFGNAMAQEDASNAMTNGTGGFNPKTGKFEPGTYFDKETNTGYTVSVDERGKVTVEGINSKGDTFKVDNIDNSVAGRNKLVDDSADNVENAINNYKDAEKKAKDALEASNAAEIEANKAKQKAAEAEKKAEETRIEAEKAEANVPDVNRDPSKGESSSDGGKAKEQAEKSMEENRGKNGMPSNL
jgi:hypothetical protein